jgi:phage tail tape-measure protein
MSGPLVTVRNRADQNGHDPGSLQGARRASREIDTVTPSTKRLGSVTDAVGRSMNAMATLTKRTGLGLIGLSAVGAKVGIDFNSRMEQSRVAFTGLLGDQQRAQTMLNQLYDLAARTPFETQQLVASTQQLLGFGLAANRVLPTMTAIGDAVAGVGGGADQIALVSLAFGQMQAKGKVSSEELLQLAEAGVRQRRPELHGRLP